MTTHIGSFGEALLRAMGRIADRAQQRAARGGDGRRAAQARAQPHESDGCKLLSGIQVA